MERYSSIARRVAGDRGAILWAVRIACCLVVAGVWVNLVGFGAAFADPRSTDAHAETVRYIYQVAGIICAAVMLAAPGFLERTRALLVVAPLCMSFATLLFAVAPSQSFAPPLLLDGLAATLLSWSYLLVIVPAYIECARRFDACSAILVLLAAQICEQLVSVSLGRALPQGIQAALCMLLPLALVPLMAGMGKVRRRQADVEQLAGMAQRHHLILLFVGGLGVIVMGAVSDVGLWGSARIAYIGEDATAPWRVAVSCLVMTLLGVVTLLPATREPLSIRYQIPFLVIVGGYMLCLGRLAGPLEHVAGAISIVTNGIEYFAHVFMFTMYVSAVQCLDMPAYRSAGVLNMASVFSLVWVALIERDSAMASVVVLAVIYAVVLVVAIHPRLLYERGSMGATRQEDINEYTIEGEPPIPAAANGVAVESVLNERGVIMARQYRLSPREQEVLELLIQGRSINVHALWVYTYVARVLDAF